MSDALTIEWPKKDVDALFRAVDAAVKYLDYDIVKGVGAAARSVIRSLGASTRISPKTRKVTAQSDGKHFDVEGYFGHPRTQKTITVRARSLANAIKYHGTIHRRGLAKQSWRSLWDEIASALGASGSSGIDSAAADISRIAKSAVHSEVKKDGINTSVLLVNKLDYIEKAL
ncbi:MAG: hypothetical protein WC378_13555, partial [Opitutaceae bacterium]